MENALFILQFLVLEIRVSAIVKVNGYVDDEMLIFSAKIFA